jgi:hypothetical protein
VDCTISNVGEKLIVGQLDTSFLTAGAKLLPGTAVINGPCYIGLTPQIGIARATCMIGPPLPGVAAPASLEVTGISNFLGNTNTIGISQFLGISAKLALDISYSVKVNVGVHISTANKVITGSLNVTGACTIGGLFTAAGGVAAPFKKFDIPHPSKEGYRLVHTCLEGPEIGVYIRGRLIKSNTIELPYYWKDLVDLETITVNLTPHNTYQELYYKIGEWGRTIKVFSNSGGIIDCSYTICAERKDLPKLVIEYKEE